MSERHIELAKHAIGLDYKKPYTRQYPRQSGAAINSKGEVIE